MHERIAATLILTAFTGLPPAFARDAPSLEPGARVRLTGLRGDFEIPGIARFLQGKVTFGPRVKDFRFLPSSKQSAIAQLSLDSGDAMLLLMKQARIEGTVVQVTSDAITIQLGEPLTVSVPFLSLARIEVSRGRESRWSGAHVGAILGAGIGIAAGTAMGGGSGGLGHVDGSLFAGTLGVGGAFCGALIGSQVLGGERFTPVQPGRFRLSAVPAPQGASLAFTFGFAGRKSR